MSNASFPPFVGQVWERLHSEMLRLAAFWGAFQELFVHGPERAELLIEAGDAFFPLVIETFLSNIHLTISKLSDPASSRSGGTVYENATLERLLDLVDGAPSQRVRLPEGESISDAEWHAETVQRLQQILADLKEHSRNIRARRNRLQAHFDLAPLLPDLPANPRPPIPPANTQEIEACLGELFDFMNIVEISYTGFHTLYTVAQTRWSVGKVLSTLKRGLRYSEMLEQKSVSVDDLRRSPYYEA